MSNDTSHLKEYPPSLNKAIALLILRQSTYTRQNPYTLADSPHFTPSRLTYQQYQQLCKPYLTHHDEYTEDVTYMGPDYWQS